MATNKESLNAHDYNKEMRMLSKKSAELKKKSMEINKKLNSTLEKCDQLLHPENQQNKQP